MFRKRRILDFEQAMRTDCAHVYRYWESLRGGRFAPTWPEFRLWELPPRVVPFCRVMDIRHDPFDAVYRFWGTGLVDAYQRDLTGESLAGLTTVPARMSMDELRRMAEDGKPFFYLSDMRQMLARNTDWRRRVPGLSPAIRVPISDDGRRLTHVVAYTDFNADVA